MKGRPELTEALGMPFSLMGASEINPDFRRLFQENYGSDCAHVWNQMSKQIASEPCLMHAGTPGCCMNPPGCEEQELDIWIIGTPCPPFSEQNPKRFKPGAVESHSLYPVRFEDGWAAIQQGHKAYLLEQVVGFDKPFDSESNSETPLERFLG